jgi:ABC-type sugar transport system permease subunit
MTVQPTMLRPATRRPTWQVGAGLVLVLPALVLLITSYVEPVFWTFRSSFNKFGGVRAVTGRGGPDQSAGWDNYQEAFQRGLGGAIAYTLLLALLPLVAVLVVAPALAWAADATGRLGRWVTRALLTFALAAFAPLGIAVAHYTDGHSQLSAFWLGTFGFVTAAAALLYLAAFRSGRSPWPGVVLGGLLAVLAVVAVVLQEFAFALVFQNVSPEERSDTPVLQMTQDAFVYFNFGLATATASVLLVPLLLLGLAATALIIVTNLRFQVSSAAREGRVWAWGPLAALLVIVLVVTLVGLWPWLSRITGDSDEVPGTFVNTWIPPLIATLIGVTVAGLAAFGISGLRPLGRYSELLLLPFGLFLFVGAGPLVLREYAAGATAGRLNTFLALVPPSRVTIPALILLAMLFRGQALRREVLLQEGRPPSWWSVIWPGLPLLGLAYLATWLVQAQDALWPYVNGTSTHPTGQYVIWTMLRQFVAYAELPYSRLLPLPMMLLFLVLGVAGQLLYLDRVALQYGLPERDHPPRT